MARRYNWLESASAAACSSFGELQFDPATSYLVEEQIPQFMQQFLANIRLPQLTQAPFPAGTPSNNPQITSLSPSEGSVGTSVTIWGYGFGNSQTPTSKVTFNGISATVATWSDSQIVVTVPPGATAGNVIVTVSASGLLLSNGAPFNNPAITSLRPSEGFVGATVTISGYRFGDLQGPTSLVTFNGIPAIVATWSNTQIAVTVPPGATPATSQSRCLAFRVMVCHLPLAQRITRNGYSCPAENMNMLNG